MGIVPFHAGVGIAGQHLDSGERAAADGLRRGEAEPALDLVDLGVGGRVVQVVAGAACQPPLDLGVPVDLEQLFDRFRELAGQAGSELEDDASQSTKRSA